jgi:hypothetical protein
MPFLFVVKVALSLLYTPDHQLSGHSVSIEQLDYGSMELKKQEKFSQIFPAPPYPVRHGLRA